MLHIENFTRRVRKVHFWHFPTKSRYRQKTCWVNSFLLIKYFIDKTRRGLTTVTKEPEVHIYKHCMKLTWHRNLLHACHSQVNNTEYVTWKQTSRNWVQRRGLNGLLVYVHISYLVLQIAQTPGIRYSIFVRNNAAHIIAHRIDYAMQFKKGLGKVDSWWTHLWASW